MSVRTPAGGRLASAGFRRGDDGQVMDGWHVMRSGLHYFVVGGQLLGRVERGAESEHRWYPAWWICGEQSGACDREDCSDAKADVEKGLAGA